ncbi:MAG: hypothetical protein ACK53L_13680, partial [Pirellulaceae bacterium]
INSSSDRVDRALNAVLGEQTTGASVNSVSVNEASTRIVFEITATSTISLNSVVAEFTPSADATSADADAADFSSSPIVVEYYVGGSWTTTKPSSLAANTPLKVSLRNINNDSVFEDAQAFSLKANVGNGQGTDIFGVGTIYDDGTGDIFNNDGTLNTTAIKDDDRPVTVSSPTVNEASPYT